MAVTSNSYGCEELAELGGVTRRTVRYYVQRGLLPPPTGTGRGKHYTQAHLDALLKIVELQRTGVALAEIPGHLATGRPPAAPQRRQEATILQSSWTRVVLGDDLELHVRGARGLDSERLARLADAVREILQDDVSESAGRTE
jgi:DNA-binding transcriptional MerR regulator